MTYRHYNPLECSVGRCTPRSKCKGCLFITPPTLCPWVSDSINGAGSSRSCVFYQTEAARERFILNLALGCSGVAMATVFHVIQNENIHGRSCMLQNDPVCRAVDKWEEKALMPGLTCVLWNNGERGANCTTPTRSDQKRARFALTWMWLIINGKQTGCSLGFLVSCLVSSEVGFISKKLDFYGKAEQLWLVNVKMFLSEPRR